MTQHDLLYDAFIIGGGINGAAVARNLANKGYYVALCDENDLSGEASCRSNKLFQCGFDHLENLDLGHVSKSLRERDALCEGAKHLMHPIDIVIPDSPTIRSSLKMKVGTLLYGWLRNSPTSPKPHIEDIHNTLYSAPLKDQSVHATLCQEYVVDDSRLVIENMLSAQQNHCQLLPRTSVVSGTRSDGTWQLTLRDTISGDESSVKAQCIVNAAGAWAYAVLEDSLGCPTRCNQPLEKHSFIAIPKFYQGNHGYMIQLPKQQFLSVLPYEHNYCLVGPLVTPTTKPSHNETVSTTESIELLEHVNSQFNTQLAQADVRWSFSTVKPSNHEAHQPVHLLDLQCNDGKSPVLSIFSGHITTHRILAEQVYECILPYLPHHSTMSATINSKLPGGDFSNHLENNHNDLVANLKNQLPWLDNTVLARYCSNYGVRALDLLKSASGNKSLGNEVIPGLFELELNWLIDNEWATCAEDILWRRTKLGIDASEQHIAMLAQWFNHHYQHQSAVSKLQKLVHSKRKAS